MTEFRSPAVVAGAAAKNKAVPGSFPFRCSLDVSALSHSVFAGRSPPERRAASAVLPRPRRRIHPEVAPLAAFRRPRRQRVEGRGGGRGGQSRAEERGRRGCPGRAQESAAAQAQGRRRLLLVDLPHQRVFDAAEGGEIGRIQIRRAETQRGEAWDGEGRSRARGREMRVSIDKKQRRRRRRSK